jgi:TonB family protein
LLAALASVLCPLAANGAAAHPNDNGGDPISAAICPIVYQVDQSPFERGYHYLFYGNGFFINDQGYLITAAHVLSQLRGGQPYLLLRAADAPLQLVQAKVVIVDREHDIAVLRATPNPFEGKFNVAWLPLATARPAQTQTVFAAALHPPNPKNARTSDALLEDHPSGEVLEYVFSQLDRGRGDTELFLFRHEVRPGQSGSPVVSEDSHAVVGLVEGRWLRSSLIRVLDETDQQSPGPGAAVPIHYALALLQQKGIAWHSASEMLPQQTALGETEESSAPIPLSLVGAPYPLQALFGGEVVLEARVDSSGTLADVKIVRGESPFLEKVLAAVRTWTFLPARSNGRVVEQRIGIVFQFPESLRTTHTAVHNYAEPLPGAPDRGALPIVTVEPEGASAASAEGSVILSGAVDAQGQLTSVQVVRDLESLAPAVVGAAQKWRFVPGKQAGANINSAVVLAVTFRRAATRAHAPPSIGESR